MVWVIIEAPIIYSFLLGCRIESRSQVRIACCVGFRQRDCFLQRVSGLMLGSIQGATEGGQISQFDMSRTNVPQCSSTPSARIYRNQHVRHGRGCWEVLRPESAWGFVFGLTTGRGQCLVSFDSALAYTQRVLLIGQDGGPWLIA